MCAEILKLHRSISGECFAKAISAAGLAPVKFGYFPMLKNRLTLITAAGNIRNADPPAEHLHI